MTFREVRGGPGFASFTDPTNFRPNPRANTMVKRLLIVLLVLGTTGCQTTVPRSSPSTETSFTDLWSTYRHCQASDNPHEMKADALHLGESLSTMHDKARYALIPDGIERLGDERPSRLAIDPGAMAASCALLAGYQARAAGRPELATEMFGHVVANYPVTRYRYYVVQAYYALKQIESGERFIPKEPLPFAPDPEILSSGLRQP